MVMQNTPEAQSADFVLGVEAGLNGPEAGMSADEAQLRLEQQQVLSHVCAA